MMKQMKRIMGLLAMAAFLVSPSLVFASGQTGVYVAPKFVYGYTLMEKTKDDWSYGSSIVKNKNMSDHAWGGALALGYDFNKKVQIPLRAELECAIFSEVSDKKSAWYSSSPTYDDLNTIKQKLQIQTLFVNAYYDFHNSTAFTPYLGGGLGLAFIRAKGNYGWDSFNGGVPTGASESISMGAKSTVNFAWNIGAGAAYAINNNISLDMGYRFAGLGGAKSKWNDDWLASGRIKTKNVYMHQVMLGARFTF